MSTTMKRGKGTFGRVVAVAAAATLAFSLAFPLSALACTQVYVGPGLTDTGDVYVGRAEDYAARHPKAFGIQEPRVNPEFSSDESNFKWTYPKTTFRYTYVRDLPSGWDNRTDAYSEAGTNEKGVSVSATLTTDYNDKIKAVDPCGGESYSDISGLGEYTIADIVLACSSTAREGVELLGSIIDTHGSYDCNQIIIADNTETWLFAQLSGHQWIGINLTAAYPDKVSVNPNIGQLKYKIDLSDKNVCLHSEKLEETAKAAGSAVYFDDGSLDVATSYGSDKPGTAQYTRLAQGRVYFGSPLADGSYTMGDKGVTSVSDPQLLFAPGNGKIDLFTALRSFAARGEQDSTLNANTNAGFYAIGNNRTVETHMYQIRKGLSADIATIQWENLSRSEFGIAVPSYSALLTQVNKDIYPAIDSWDEKHTGAKESVDSVDAAMDASTDNGSLDYVLMDINTLAYNNRDKLAGSTRTYLDALQKQLIAQQAVVDEIMQKTPAAERTDLANKLHDRASSETYAKAKALLDDMRAYLKGDQSAPFVPSDLDEATGLPKAPISYATPFVAPVFVAEPADATVEKGSAITLSAQANIPDGVEGSESHLAYEWFDADNPAAPIATGSKLDIDTSTVGSASYYCVATNDTSGLKATSRTAAITVSEPQAAPGAKTETSQKTTVAPSGDKGAHKAPQTSDPLSPVVPIALASAGAALAVATSLRARKGEK